MPLDKIDELIEQRIEEAKRTSRTVVKRNTKIKRATSSMATSMARKKNDSAYKQMVRYRTLYFKYRAIVHKKYSPRTRSAARR